MATRQGGRRVRGEHQLPAGRHGLSPTFVIQNQRQRMMVALAQAVAEVGYAAFTVEDVVARAGVSRRTFYDQFANKHDAFLAAYDEVSGGLLAGVRSAFRDAPTFAEKVERGLHAFVAYLVSERDFAHMCIVDVLGAGPAAIERRNGVIRAFVEQFEQAAAEAGYDAPPLMCEAAVGAIHEIVYARLRAGLIDELPRLVPDLVYVVLLPFVGEEEAAQARARAAARPQAPVSA
jgi:AcrR family transcriptional regulator